VFCLANRPNDGRLRLFRRGAIVLVVAGLLLAFGDHGPVGWIVAKLPLVSNFRFPCRAIVLVHLGLAVLATVGIVSLLVGVPFGSEPQGRRPPFGSAMSKRRDLAILSAIVALSVFLAIAGPVLWPEYVAAASLVWTGPLLIALAAGLVVLARLQGKWAIPALMLMSAIDLGTYGMSYAVYPQSATLDEYLASIPRPPGPPRQRVALDLLAANQSGLHAGNQMLLRGYERADGYAGLEPLRQLDYRQTAARRLAGVEWVARDADIADRKALPGSMTDRWLRIENPLPRARLVSHVAQSTDPQRDLTIIPFESSALAEQPLELNPGLPGTATILADRPGDIRIAVDSPSRQLLVLAESLHAGWQATIDGQPRPVLRVNGDFMGCVVNAGKSEIHFEFRPASLRYGRWLSILGLGLIGAAMLAVTLTRSVSEGQSPRGLAYTSG
jgi:Bacterial membrane protein YfhO